MKTKLTLLLVVLLPIAAHAADDLSAALQKGLFEEEANQNLPAAIKAYESLLATSDDQRKLAATALFRLGECYRKLGKTNDAVAQYQRLLRDYADQTTLATLSRQNLTGLGTVQNAAGARMASAPGGNEAQRLLIERLELEIKTAESEVANYEKMIQEKVVPANSGDKVRARLLDLRRQLLMAQDSGTATTGNSGEAAQVEALLKQLRDLNRTEVQRVLPTVAPDALLNTLLEQRSQAERKLATERVSFSGDHPSVKAATDAVKILHEQIDERIDGILKGLEIKLAALKQQSAAAGSSGGGGRGGGAVVPLSEEEQEIRRIQALIKDSPDLINAVNVEVAKVRSGELMVPKNGTLLHKAANQGQLSVAKFLLDNGADVSARDEMGRTPLHRAAGNGHRAMVELLLANKADANAKVLQYPDNGSTSLHLAVSKGYRTVCESLLARGADPNLGDGSGTPPIYSAVLAGDEASVRLLLSKGAKVNPEPGKKAYTPLHNATRTNIVKMLIEAGAMVDALNSMDQSPLHYCASEGRQDVVEALLAAGANPNLKDKDGKRPLHLAAARWRASVVAPLIAKGANPNERSAYGGVPLDELIKFSESSSQDVYREPQLETLQAFLAGGADPNLTIAGGVPHLFRAVSEGLEEQAEALLKAGADPNARSDYDRPGSSNLKGQTPLIRALRGTKRPSSGYGTERTRSMAMVNLLLEHKADVNLADGDGGTPLYYAIVYGSQDFAEKVPFVETLLKHGANIEGRISSGDTPLTIAASGNIKGMAELLLKHKADPNAKAGTGKSPLHLAAANRNMELVDILLAAGADPNALDAQGLSALDYAKMAGSSPRPGGIGMALPAFPVPNVPGQQPPQPKEIAQSNLADRLRKAGARDWAPRPGLITVTRRSTSASQVIFTKGTNDWNRHSLLELITFTYFGSGTPFPFPDFSRLMITRRDPASGAVKEFTVDLTAKLAAEGCKADEWLEWGDLVEIPEGVHRLDEKWSALPEAEASSFEKCIARKVTLKAGAGSKELELVASRHWRYLAPNNVGRYTREHPPRLRDVVLKSGMLLTSSDLSRTKVTRQDATGGRREWTFDLTKSIPEEQDLWLRDGDVIEVPEK